MEKVLVLLMRLLINALAEVHTLHRYSIAMSGIKSFPNYIQNDVVDDKVLSHYDSTTQRKAPAQCMKSHLDRQFWKWSMMDTASLQKIDNRDFEQIQTQLKNKTGEQNVLQRIYSCEWDNRTAERRSYTVLTGYNGEDFTLSTGVKDKQRSTYESQCQEICFEHLKNYVLYGNECLKRVPPEVSLFQNSSVVMCHATGFYPKAVNITWKRDKMEIKEDVYVRETLPNGDGTFQKRAVLTASPEERRKRTYTCEVEHKTGLVIKTLVEENRPWSWIGIGIGIGILFGIGIGIGIPVLRHNKQDQEAPSWCLELINRNDRSAMGSAEPMMAGANNVPTYS